MRNFISQSRTVEHARQTSGRAATSVPKKAVFGREVGPGPAHRAGWRRPGNVTVRRSLSPPTAIIAPTRLVAAIDDHDSPNAPVVAALGVDTRNSPITADAAPQPSPRIARDPGATHGGSTPPPPPIQQYVQQWVLLPAGPPHELLQSEPSAEPRHATSQRRWLHTRAAAHVSADADAAAGGWESVQAAIRRCTGLAREPNERGTFPFLSTAVVVGYVRY